MGIIDWYRRAMLDWPPKGFVPIDSKEDLMENETKDHVTIIGERPGYGVDDGAYLLSCCHAVHKLPKPEFCSQCGKKIKHPDDIGNEVIDCYKNRKDAEYYKLQQENAGLRCALKRIAKETDKTLKKWNRVDEDGS